MTPQIKRNNPGNIRPATKKWLGEITPQGAAYSSFETLEYGCRALLKLLSVYINRHNLTTIEKIIYRWAPPQDRNHTEIYVNVVCKKSGLGRKQSIEATKEFLIPIAKAMTEVEHGRNTSIPDETWEKAWSLL